MLWGNSCSIWYFYDVECLSVPTIRRIYPELTEREIERELAHVREELLWDVDPRIAAVFFAESHRAS